MKAFPSVVLSVALVALTLGWPGTTRTEEAVGYGTLTGGALGAALTAFSHAIMGGYIDRQECNAIQTARGYNYQPRQGAMVKVEEVGVQPEVVEPGSPSLLVMTYAVLNPNPNARVQVQERRQIISGREVLKEIGPITVDRAPGTYYSEQGVTFPKGLPMGRYSMKAVVEAGGKTSQLESHFQIAWVPSDSGYAYLIRKLDSP